MSEWNNFDKIVQAKGMWLIDSNGNKMLDGVASMWCNVWGHSKAELIRAITNQTKKLQHSALFNLTNEPIEELSERLIKISPGMYRVFYSDNGSTAMEIALKMALQYWQNIGKKTKTEIATLENGYHGDTIGAMSVGYIPEFFSKFKNKLFTTQQFPTPNRYRVPNKMSFLEYQEHCLDKIEKEFSKNSKIAAFIMESGAQVAGGVIIYPKQFQMRIKNLCKKYNVLFVLDEIATGFGRLGSMIQYVEQNSMPDIVAYGKMLTGGYLTMAATLASKKIYDSFSGKFYDWKHLFHGHTYTGNPISAAVANENLKLYHKNQLIKKIKKTSNIFTENYNKISELRLVGDIRHKGMLMGIELVTDKKKKTPIRSKISINKIFYEYGKRNGVYLRTLGNIIMLVPPLDISENELELLILRTISTIKLAERQFLK